MNQLVFILVLGLLGLLGLLTLYFLINKNKVEQVGVESFNNAQVFQDNIDEVIFNINNPFPLETEDVQIPLPLSNYCEVYGSNNDNCGMLTDDNCKSSTCCVLTNSTTQNSTLSNPQCMGGSAFGPTFNSDATNYYYMNKLYSLYS